MQDGVMNTCNMKVLSILLGGGGHQHRFRQSELVRDQIRTNNIYVYV